MICKTCLEKNDVEVGRCTSYGPCADCGVTKSLYNIGFETDFVVFNFGEIELPLEALKNQPRMGSCDSHVDFWYEKIDWSQVGPTDEGIRQELYDYGAWDDDELRNVVENRKRILWIAAGNWQEENE